MSPQRAMVFALAVVSLATGCGGHRAGVGEEPGTAESANAESESMGAGTSGEISGETSEIPNCEAADFADPALEQYIRDALGVGDGPISGEAMLALTTIRVETGEMGRVVQLQSLTGLECAVNLEELTWEDGLAGDFEGGLDPLAGLSELRTLVLEGGPLVSLDPLAGLGQLEVLDWRALETDDLAPLAGLTSLRSLLLRGNRVTDVGPLAGLADLEELDLFSSPSFDSAIVDVSALAGLTNLRRLDINGNHVVDVSPLAGLAKLEEVALQQNEVVDLGPLAGLPALHTLDALGNPVVDVFPLVSLAQVYSINLSGAQIADLSGWVGHTWPTPMGCADIRLTFNPLTDQTVAQDLPLICAANPGIALWIGLGEDPFCNPIASCP